MITSQQLRRFKHAMNRRPTKHEGIFTEILKEFGIEYKRQLILGFYILDFVIPSKMLVIEIDGKSHDIRKDYDKRRDDFIKACGFSVVHIKNENIEDVDIKKITDCYPDFDLGTFRSALARGGAIKNSLRKGHKLKTYEEYMRRFNEKKAKKEKNKALKKVKKKPNILDPLQVSFSSEIDVSMFT